MNYKERIKEISDAMGMIDFICKRVDISLGVSKVDGNIIMCVGDNTTGKMYDVGDLLPPEK